MRPVRALLIQFPDPTKFLILVYFKQMVSNEDKQDSNTLLDRPFERQIFKYFKITSHLKSCLWKLEFIPKR